MRRSIVLLVCVLTLGVASASQAAVIDDSRAYVLVNGQVAGSLELIPKNGDADQGATFEFSQEILIGEDLLVITGGGNTDPFMGLAVAYTDFGAPSPFTTTLVAPIGPVLFGPVTVTVSHSGSWTNSATNGSIAFTAAPATAQFDINGTIVPAWNIGPGFGPIATGPNTSGNYGPFNPAPFAFVCPPEGCSSMSITIAGTGSGGGDAYTLNAGLDITPAAIPEPGTLTLLGLGLVAMGRRFRRR